MALNLETTLHFAQKLAIELGTFAHESRHGAKVVVQKDIRDICTNLDKEVEKRAIEAISTEFPDHTIFSEERGLIDKHSEYTWYIDPIDGTKEFIKDIPLYDTCLTLEDRNSTILGVVYYPVSQKLWSASLQHSSKRNQTPIQVSSINAIKEAFVYFYVPNTKHTKTEFKTSWDTFGRIAQSSYRLRGSALNIVDLCYVAEGSAEGFVALHADKTHGWEDVAAGLLLVQQAGGTVTDTQGRPIRNQDLKYGIVATNGRIHDELLNIINQT